MLIEGHGRCGIIHVPAEATVIEVDHLHSVAIDQQVRQAQVRMNETEALTSHAIGGQSPADEIDSALEQLLLLVIHPHTVTPAAPVRAVFAECRVEVPCVAGEP